MLRDGVAERYIPARNAAASPYRFELDASPEIWFLEDDGYELAVFHSHLSSPPRPSRTDVENIGLWEGRPYVILTVRSGELAAWRIRDGRVEPEEPTTRGRGPDGPPPSASVLRRTVRRRHGVEDRGDVRLGRARVDDREPRHRLAVVRRSAARRRSSPRISRFDQS